MPLTPEQIEYEAHLNKTEKDIANRMEREAINEQPFKDDALNFIYPFFESIWDADEYQYNDDWMHHEEDAAP